MRNQRKSCCLMRKNMQMNDQPGIKKNREDFYLLFMQEL